MDNVGIVVDDLPGAIAFFVELGLELEGEAQVEGRSVDRLIGLDGVLSDIAMMRTPDGHGRLELSKFHNPKSITLTNVVITDVFDPRLVDIKIVSVSKGTAVVAGSVVTVTGFTLAPGENARLVVRVKIGTNAKPGDIIGNLATLESPNASTHTSNTVYISILPSQLPSTGEHP
jgi:hypothetical protein